MSSLNFPNFKEIPNDEDWELFARDYLAENGFVIEVEPGRGHDHGKDIIVSEQLRGRIRTQKFTWLVSCKHFALSNKSVGVSDEESILDRVSQHEADGFICFYSTLASSSLIERLHELKKTQKIADFEIFDRKKIEAAFFKNGFSNLAIRYFPESYRVHRPLQALWGSYEPLYCEVCGIDILEASILKPYKGIVLMTMRSTYNRDTNEDPDDEHKIFDVYTVCKGDCDDSLEERLFRRGFITGWEDVHDLCNPLLFMKNLMS